jgi:hypothetical protein
MILLIYIRYYKDTKFNNHKFFIILNAEAILFFGSHAKHVGFDIFSHPIKIKMIAFWAVAPVLDFRIKISNFYFKIISNPARFAWEPKKSIASAKSN